METEEKIKKREGANTPKRTARLIICQALHMFFDQNNEEKDVEKILFIIDKYYIDYTVKDYYTANDIEKDAKSSVYRKLYKSSFVKNTVNYVLENIESLDSVITKFLVKEEPLETLDLLLVQIMRSALAEAKLYPDLNKKVIVSEYNEIVSEFYDDISVSFLNGILMNIFNGGEDGQTKRQANIKIENDTVENNVVESGKNGRKILNLKKK